MKKFLNFLNEKNLDVDFVVNQIKEKCQPYLNVFDTALFRGLNDLYEFEILKRYKNRTPRSTTLEAHKKLDDMFLEYHGWRSRSEGVFTDQFYGNEYGEYLYLFFPIGELRYLWHPEITDLLKPIENSNFYSTWQQQLQYLQKPIKNEVEWEKAREEYFGEIIEGYKTDGVPTNKKTEIMFDVDEYYVLYYENNFGDKNAPSQNYEFCKKVLKKLDLKIK